MTDKIGTGDSIFKVRKEKIWVRRHRYGYTPTFSTLTVSPSNRAANIPSSFVQDQENFLIPALSINNKFKNNSGTGFDVLGRAYIVCITTSL
jgi:hypothetical protein